MLYERSGAVVRITLNRPEKRNALSLPVLRELTEAFTAAGKTDASGVVLAAEGRCSRQGTTSATCWASTTRRHTRCSTPARG